MASRVDSLALAFVWMSVVACGESPPPPAADAGDDVCTADGECDDGIFCSGLEACSPGDPLADARGCVVRPACANERLRCLEATRECVANCALAPDADGDGAVSIDCDGPDCDDTDAMAYPGALEVCDPIGRDEDCDPVTLGSRDSDSDGYIDAACCNGTRCGDDCADSRRDAHPGSTEACEGIDNDCDGAIDEGLLVVMYRDEDFDLHGTMASSMAVCPGTPGWSLTSDDCDDTSPVRHGAQLEICDSIDNDCDGMSDEAPVAVPWYPDQDGDLFGTLPDDPGEIVISCMPVSGRSTRSSDCDDGDAAIHPGAREVCNGRDDDCNGRADAPGVRGGDTEDDDLDGEPDRACGGGDCDDADPSVYPRATEICNMRDDDCDGAIDGGDTNSMWYVDADRDGFGDTAPGAPAPIVSCDPQAGRVPRGGDCDDGDGAIHPRTADGCDGTDDDCDEEIDENGIRFAYFPDADRDGWGSLDARSAIYRCTMPAGTVDRSGDCADTDPMRYPDALEQCQGIDDDCDAAIDEDSDRMWFVDADEDGHGVGAPIVACMMPAGRAPLGDDCDDADAGRFPGATELCNGRDEDCDSMIDDGASAACAGRPHATGTCVSGACSSSCDAGYLDCDLDPTSGCETDIARSAEACGSCTGVCAPADTCGTTAAGSCDRSLPTAVFAAEEWSAVLRANARVAVWGNGDGNGASTFTYDLLQPRTAPLTGIAEVEPSATFGCARTLRGTVSCWGANGYGQLGDGTLVGRLSPRPVLGIADAIDLDVGNLHACVVHADGAVSCWGSNVSGQLGDGTNVSRDEPVLVPGIADAIAVGAAQNFTCVLRGALGARQVVCFGVNNNGQLGIGTTMDQRSPGAPVIGLGPDVIALARTTELASSMCARIADGRVMCWGYNYAGAGLGLGMGSPTNVTSAIEMPGISDAVDVMLMRSGGCMRRHGAGAIGGELWCWGYQTMVGWIDGGSTSRDLAVHAGGASTIDDAVSFAVGEQRWCAIRGGGAVWCAGDGANGALGNGGTSSSAAPVMVRDLP